MSVQFDTQRQRSVVRWYQAGRQRSRRFADEPAARTFDADRAQTTVAAREASAMGLAGEVARLRARVERVER